MWHDIDPLTKQKFHDFMFLIRIFVVKTGFLVVKIPILDQFGSICSVSLTKYSATWTHSCEKHLFKEKTWKDFFFCLFKKYFIFQSPLKKLQKVLE